MYKNNSDYLQMLIKIHHTEELPSFYVMICCPSAKFRMLGVYANSHHSSWDNGELAESWLTVPFGCSSAGEGQTQCCVRSYAVPVPIC